MNTRKLDRVVATTARTTWRQAVAVTGLTIIAALVYPGVFFFF